MPRFVILHHQVPHDFARQGPCVQSLPEPRGSHFDWMFERQDPESGLQTWATETLPSLDEEFEVDAVPLADHRPAYLEYEGEISGGRGEVRRVTDGNFTSREQSATRWSAQLTWLTAKGERVAQLVIQRRCFDDSTDGRARAVWRLRFSPWR